MFTYTKKERQILEKNYEEAMKDENFVKIVNHFHLTKEEAMKKTSKLEESVKELEHCKKCK